MIYGMTEAEYIAATGLLRLRIARNALADVLAVEGVFVPLVHLDMVDALGRLDVAIGETERRVDAMLTGDQDG